MNILDTINQLRNYTKALWKVKYQYIIKSDTPTTTMNELKELVTNKTKSLELDPKMLVFGPLSQFYSIDYIDFVRPSGWTEYNICWICIK